MTESESESPSEIEGEGERVSEIRTSNQPSSTPPFPSLVISLPSPLEAHITGFSFGPVISRGR